jgi:tRNA threonylcarbamoyladenosine biosynthesis protein TsaB
MLGLGIDTSTMSGAVVVFRENQILSACTANVRAFHSERLLHHIDHCLKAAQLDLKDMDAFAVGIGPGSFTGLRIGLSTMRSFAQIHQKPLIRIPSLLAQAAPFFEVTPSGILATANAFRGEIFLEFFPALDSESPSRKEEGSERSLLRQEVGKAVKPSLWIDAFRGECERSSELQPSPERPLFLLGNGVFQYRQVFETSFKEELQEGSVKILDRDQIWITPQGLVQVANECWKADQVIHDFRKLEPHYIRPSDAERKLKAGIIKPYKHQEDVHE